MHSIEPDPLAWPGNMHGRTIWSAASGSIRHVFTRYCIISGAIHTHIVGRHRPDGWRVGHRATPSRAPPRGRQYMLCAPRRFFREFEVPFFVPLVLVDHRAITRSHMAFVGFHHRHRRPTTDKDRQFGIVDSVGSVGFQLADVRKKRNRRIAESPPRGRF